MDAGDVQTDVQTAMQDAAADGGDAGPRNILETVAETRSWAIPGLESTAYVLYTANNVPHVYAANRRDLARIHGFTVARDRFFVMDMARRLSLGTFSSLLGQDGLVSDMQSRGTGTAWVTQKIFENFTPEQTAMVDAYAAGINTYIEQVRLGRLRAPSEFELAKTLLGVPRAVELMHPFARVDVAAVLATLVYQLGYETDDPGTALAEQSIPNLFPGCRVGSPSACRRPKRLARTHPASASDFLGRWLWRRAWHGRSRGPEGSRDQSRTCAWAV